MNPPDITGSDGALAMQKNLFSFDVNDVTETIDNTIEEALENHKNGIYPVDPDRKSVV